MDDKVSNRKVYIFNYKIKNKDKLTEYHKRYNIIYVGDNIGHLSEKIICDVCGRPYQRWNKSTHFKSNIHNQTI